MEEKYLLVLDFEANCTANGVRDHEICEFPVVLLNSRGENIAEFRTFVKPVRIRKISNFIHELTGITDENIATGMYWSDALIKFDEWCKDKGVNAGNATVVTCGDWDLKTMLPRQHSLCKTYDLQSTRVRQLFETWTNIKLVYAEFKKYRKLLGMTYMLSDADLPLVGRHHSGIDDCRNIANICKYLIKNGKWDELFRK